MVVTATLPEKFEQLQDAVNGRLVERTSVVSTATLALISGTHHFQLGPPGIAKSLTVRTFKKFISGMNESSYFETLMTRFSAPEEVFGPYDLPALKEGRFRRITTLMLPEAYMAFLDEIFKANSSVLNALLTITNERTFRNDGHINEVPLWTLFCASNEMPEGEELNALYDRIHFRHILTPIKEPGNFITMLKRQFAGEPEAIVSRDEIAQAATEARAVEIPMDVYEAMNTLRGTLHAQSIEPTDRRFAECLKVVRAAAWLRGETVADIEDMRPLAHMLWDTPDEAPKVDIILAELANPIDKEAMELIDRIEKLRVTLDKTLSDKDTDPAVKNKTGVELHNKADRAKQDLQKLKTQTENSKRKSPKVDEAQQALLGLTRRLLKEIFNIDPNLDEEK